LSLCQANFVSDAAPALPDGAPKVGDVVIAEVDGEWTMKYFKKQGGKVYLEAANPKYPIIWPKTELLLGGVVTAVIRKYH
jgi:SOS-response transcriptional repressor LexA